MGKKRQRTPEIRSHLVRLRPGHFRSPISSSKPISRHHRKQRKTGLPRTAFGADSNALITPQNMKNMKLDVNSYADHACGARRAPETTPNPAQPLARPPHLARRPPAHHQIAHSGSAKGAVDDFITSACPETCPFGLARSFKPSPSRRSTAHSATDDQDHKLRF